MTRHTFKESTKIFAENNDINSYLNKYKKRSETKKATKQNNDDPSTTQNKSDLKKQQSAISIAEELISSIRVLLHCRPQLPLSLKKALGMVYVEEMKKNHDQLIKLNKICTRAAETYDRDSWTVFLITVLFPKHHLSKGIDPGDEIH